MARRLRNSKGRFIKVSRHRKRKNGGGVGRAGFAAARAAQMPAPSKKRKKSKSRKGRKTRSASGRRIRPTIIVTRTGHYRRPSRSKYFKRPRMVNPKRRKSRVRRSNGNILATVKRLFTVNTMSSYLSIGGGVLAGGFLSRMLTTGMVPFTTTALPSSISETLNNKYVRPFHGVLHIVLGTLIASKVRNKYVRDAGMGLAAIGGYDLLSQALSFLGMSALPTLSGMNVNMLGRTSYSGMNVDLLGGGMNVDLMGDARASDAESGYLADNINDMLS